jgi:glycosyltransferase involved in cell wall biosynthesis
MRVLHVHSALQGGGIANMMTDLASEQGRRGHEVAICHFRSREDALPEGARDSLEASGITLFGLDPVHVMAPDYALGLFRVTRRYRPHVLHLHGATIGCVGAVVGRFARVPVVLYTEHLLCWPLSPSQERYCPAPWIRRLRSATAPLLHCTVAISEAVRSALPRRSRLVRVIYNGVDLTPYDGLNRAECRRSLRTYLGLGDEAIVVVGVGHLTPRKAYAAVVEAAASLRKKQETPVHLVLCGEGPERAALLAQAEASGVPDAVHLLGWVGNVPEILMGADVFVHAALIEGFGLVVAEAGAAGLPVIATRVGGVPEIIDHEVTGLLVEPGCGDALREALAGLAADPMRRRELGEHARAHVRERFSLEGCTEAYLALYSALASAKDVRSSATATGAN